MSARIGVKFCGHCNPQVDMTAVLAQVQARALGWSFGRWDEDGYDVLLVLGACPAVCASRPAFAGPAVVAASDAVDGWPVARDRLAAEIVAAVGRHVGRRGDNASI